MNVTEIVQQLMEERGRLDAAIQALEGVGGGVSGGGKRRGRPPGTKNHVTPATGAPKKRAMSKASRQRIAEAMRKRWAAAKKSGKKRLT
jgi:hypothetical protein